MEILYRDGGISIDGGTTSEKMRDTQKVSLSNSLHQTMMLKLGKRLKTPPVKRIGNHRGLTKRQAEGN